VAEAVRIARRTRHIVRFNITLSIAVKAAVLLLGGAGLAPLWLAVLADTGVALLCVLNVFTLWR
jgi:Cd2+/Zn2+-exporting ATPase